MKGYWWLSFAWTSGFLGTVVVEARVMSKATEEEKKVDLMRVLQHLHNIGQNPGGEAQAALFDLPAPPPEELTRVVRTKERADELSEEWYRACEATGVPKFGVN